MSNITKKYSRRTIALFILVAVGVVITTLVVLEQIAVLYVLATLALVALMLIVAFDDLEKVDRDAIDGFTPADKK
jgi:UDP-N-acetylmuramyl pentapeptide phosphotransferase/UDP-N-acetylglucosamine-1-phosphate transferase